VIDDNQNSAEVEEQAQTNAKTKKASPATSKTYILE